MLQSLLEINVTDVVLHKLNEPDVVDFFYTNSFARKAVSRVDFLSIRAETAAVGDELLSLNE